MLSPEAKQLSKQIGDIRLRTERAKDEVITLARTAVLVLKDHSPSLGSEMERRLFIVDSEQSALTDLLKADGNLEKMLDLMTESFKDKG